MVLVGRASGDDKPWAAGVSEQEQKVALAIYEQGNKEFEESRYAQALVKYREALAHWDHPAIHFNIGVALVNLDQPLEAYPHFIAAMKFGEAALGSKFASAVQYQQQLDRRLVHLRVTSDFEGAEVTFDGKPILRDRGEAETLALPGEHQIVASKPGYVTETTRLALAAGESRVHAVVLVVERVKTRVVGGLSPRRKLAIAGGGVALASLATGIVTGVIANNKRDQAFALCMDPKVPCANAARADQLVLTGHHYAIAADVAFAVAGAAAIGAGALWLTGGQEPVLVPTASGVAIVGRF